MKNEIPSCVKWSGFLGHNWVTTCFDGDSERVRAECNTGSSAFQYWSDEPEQTRGHIYERTRRGWRRVRPAAASIA